MTAENTQTKQPTTPLPALKPGDTLWMTEPHARRGGVRPVVISGVGRKWITLREPSNFQVCVKTLGAYLPKYGWRGQCYLSEEEYAQKVALGKALQLLQHEVQCLTADEVTLAQIQSACAIFGIKMTEAAP